AGKRFFSSVGGGFAPALRVNFPNSRLETFDTDQRSSVEWALCTCTCDDSTIASTRFTNDAVNSWHSNALQRRVRRSTRAQLEGDSHDPDVHLAGDDRSISNRSNRSHLRPRGALPRSSIELCLRADVDSVSRQHRNAIRSVRGLSSGDLQRVLGRVG